MILTSIRAQIMDKKVIELSKISLHLDAVFCSPTMKYYERTFADNSL